MARIIETLLRENLHGVFGEHDIQKRQSNIARLWAEDGRAHGRAANAADRARNQNRLASLDATRYGYELAPRDRDERECGCLDQVNAIGDSRKNAGLNSTQLRVRMEGPCKHVIANGELVHFQTKANNGPGHIPTDDGRELDAQRRFYCTGSLPKINRIDTRRRNSD